MPERYLGRTLGKYRIESLLGTGGFAWVFKGYDPELDIPVAVKVLKPQFAGDQNLVERFRREASTAAKLRHPNIVKIYAVGREGDAVYFVMDYLPSGLADKLEATPSLPEDYVVRIGIDVARALGFAHREGVIHRDIKVDNIMFDAHGNAIVADFGIARAVSGYTQQTGTNMVVGTPQYFAPEQARAKPLDGRADIYSLGVTLFRASTGRLPFDGEDWYEIARQHVEEPPPSPRSLNPALSGEFDSVLMRCLAKPADERPASGEDLAEELENMLASRRDITVSRTMAVPVTSGANVGGKLQTPSPVGARRVSTRVILPAVFVLLLGLGGLAFVLAGSFHGATIDTLVTMDTAEVLGPTDTVNAGVDSGRDTSTRASSESLKTAPVARATLAVTAPDGAMVSANDVVLGTGSFRIDTIPGNYTLAASVSTIAGCPTATDQKTVTLRPGRAPTTVSFSPRPCGTLEISGALGYRANRPVVGRIEYTVLSGGAVVVREFLPLASRSGERSPPLSLILPAGTYELRLIQPQCMPYIETSITISAGETHRITSARIPCP